MKQGKQDNPEFGFSFSAVYQIIVDGELSEDWSDQINGMKINIDNSGDKPITKLSGRLSDQAALSGVLNTLYSFHLSIISVEKM